MSGRGKERRIYIGNLPPDVRNKDLEDLFSKYGKITYLELKDRKSPPFAFLEYDDPRDAEDAVYAKDGYNFDGYRLRVEYPKGGGASFRPQRDGGGGRGGGGRGNNGGYRRTEYRVTVTGLPPSGSWQDLKDHMRDAGEVTFADVNRDGTGVVEFSRYEDMKYAAKKLDDTKFKSHEGETAYIRVKEDYRGSSRRSRSNSRSRSRSRSPKRKRGSPSYSPAKKDRDSSRSKSGSRSRSRSRS